MAITKASLIDLNGQELILDVDADTSITADTDDRIDFKTGGTDRVHINTTGLGVGTASPDQLLEIKETSTTSGVHFPITLGGANHAAGYAVGLGLDPEGAGSINKIAIVAEGTGQGYSRGKLHFLLDSANDNNQSTLAESRMVIQDNGNVGISTASPTTRLQIMAASDEEDVVLLEDNSGTDVGALRIHGGAFMMKGKSASAPVQMQTHDGNEDIEVDPDGFIKMETAGSERLRIDSSGNVGFSTTDFTTSNGNVGKTFAYEAASNNIVNVYHLNTATRHAIFEARRNGRTNERMAQISLGENSSAEGVVFIYGSAANADVSGGVNLTAAATSFSGNSDIRLKTVTGTYDNALQDIAKIEPIKFTWKADSTNKANVGVSAQSVQKVVPEAVVALANPLTPDDETEYLNVRYTELMPLMIASIQELSTELETAKARIKTLEDA